MPGTSAYAQISQYALLEYQYNNESIPIGGIPGSGAAGALRLENKYMGTYQYLNTSPSVNITGNVLDRTAGRMGPLSNKWAYFDIDTAVPIYQTNSNFSVIDYTQALTPLAGRYDRARLHILSGFDFPGLDGIILQLQWKQWVLNETETPKRFDACNYVYLRGQTTINLNPVPLFLGDRLYDRYIDVKIPSLNTVNADFWNSPTATNTIGYNYTFNNVGFDRNSQIYINLFEVDSSEVINGNLYLYTGNSYKAAINSEDNYSQLGLVIKEDEFNDYIEYYPTWNGAFIENYINDLNSVGGDWVVINQIELYEQVGTSRLRTANMTMLQDGNYDQPMVYRPVIMNPSVAYSYTIEYTMRFFNRVDNTEIIRTAAYTSTNAKKYGKQLEKINALQGFTPVKVFNKVVRMNSEDTEDFAGLRTQKEVITQKVIVPVYYDTNLISVSSTDDVTATLGEIVYGQGANTIFMGPFDNFIKFKIFTKSADKSQDVSLDLTKSITTIALSFNTTDNNKLFIPAYQDINLANPNMGEVLFKIDAVTAVKLLSVTDKTYYIINRTDPETMLYTGTYRDSKEKGLVNVDALNTALNRIENQIRDKQQTLATLNSSITAGGDIATTGGRVTNAGASPSMANAIISAEATAQQEVSQTLQSNLTAAQSATQSALQQAATGAAPLPNIVEIPGVSSNLGANPQIALTPQVQNPAQPDVGFNPDVNPTTQGNTPNK